MGFGSKILNNSVGSLLAQQAVIATTSNNIANANTPGYARRTLELETRTGSVSGGQISIGNGVEIGRIVRSVDVFVDKLLREAGGEKAGFDVENDILNRVQNLFSLNESAPTIGSTLTEFYNAVNDLAANPASLELRSNMIERGKDLVNTIKTTYTTIGSLQTQADSQIKTEIDSVNTLATQIADLNGQVRTRESTGNVAADERDQRDVLLQKLAEKVQYTLLEDPDGTTNIFIGKGFALVSGSTARQLDYTQTPSFAAGSTPPSLSGGALGYIVYDYDSSAGSSHIDLTQSMQAGSGTIGSLLRLRGYNDPSNTSAFQSDGSLVDVASRIEAIARTLLTSVNRTYLGASDEDPGTAGFQASSGDLYGASPSPFGLFSFAGASDPNSDGLPTGADLTTIGYDNYASLLTFNVTDPKSIAAAYDSDPTAGATTFPPGDGQNLLALSTILQSTNLSFAQGSFSFTGSFDQAYNEAVSHVGVLKSTAASNQKVADANYVAAQSKHDSVSGVSLDEEFSGLIKFQKAFQASARMIKVADDLLDQIVRLI